MTSMIHIQVGEDICSIELMYDILKRRHDGMGSRNGFIGLSHIHVQSNFVGRSFGCNHNWDTQVSFSTFSITSSPISFSNSASSVGLALNGILL